MSDSTAPGPLTPASPTGPEPVPLIPRPGSSRPESGRGRPTRARSGRRPLPDAQAICRFTVPEVAPPYDDAGTGTERRLRLAGTPPAREAAARDATVGRPSTAAFRGTRSADRVPAARQPGSQLPTADSVPHARPLGSQPPPANAWPSRFAQVLAETLAGSRPASQIAPWTTQQTRRQIGQLGPMLGASHRPRVKRVIVTSPAGGVLEMSVVVAVGDQVRAVAVRLERARPAADPAPAATPSQGGYRRSQGDWLCTAIEAA